MGLVQRIIAGSHHRKTRFHDATGRAAGWAALRNVPRSLYSTLLYRLWGVAQDQPWLSYDAIRDIELLLSPRARVLEWGAGGSTVWFAQRAEAVLRIETDPAWVESVRARLAARGLRNVTIELRSPTNCASLPAIGDESFDFALVDGPQRLECLRTALAAVRHGGWIYVDNTDQQSTEMNGDVPEARRLLIEHAARAHTPCHVYTDFGPLTFIAWQGVLAQV